MAPLNSTYVSRLALAHPLPFETFVETDETSASTRFPDWSRIKMPFSTVSSRGVVALPYSCVHIFSALAAVAKAVVGARKNSIVFGKFVAVNAMCLLGVFGGRANPSEIVNSGGHVFDVDWVHAPSVSAKMISFAVWCDGMHEHFKRGALRRLASAFVGELRIAIYRNVAAPYPARVAVVKQRGARDYFAEEAKEDVGINGKSAKIVLNHLSLRNRFNGLGFRGLTHREALSF